MSKFRFIFTSSLFALLCLTSCSITQAIKLKDCEYTYSHISDITFMDMVGKERRSIAGVTMMTKALLGKTDQVRMGCTVHLRVHNPNKNTASVDKLFYTVAVDSILVAEGSTTEPLIVAGESTAEMPIILSVDVKQLMKEHSKATMVNIVKTFLGMSDTPLHITLTLKPLIRVGSASVAITKPIPISFDYGGKKE